MKGVELYRQVRRAVYVEGLSRREAARQRLRLQPDISTAPAADENEPLRIRDNSRSATTSPRREPVNASDAGGRAHAEIPNEWLNRREKKRSLIAAYVPLWAHNASGTRAGQTSSGRKATAEEAEARAAVGTGISASEILFRTCSNVALARRWRQGPPVCGELLFLARLTQFATHMPHKASPAIRATSSGLP